jgi:AbrB family looped-hinge helix DNA binding protein
LYYESRVTRQGQTTIPKDLREKYGLEEGDEVTYIDLGDRIVLLPKPRDPIKALKRIAVDTDQNIQDIKKEALEAALKEATQGRGE